MVGISKYNSIWRHTEDSLVGGPVGTYFDEDLKTYVTQFIWSSNTRRIKRST